MPNCAGAGGVNLRLLNNIDILAPATLRPRCY